MEGDGAMPQSEGEISRKSQVDFAEEERASLPRELRRKWVSLREEWSNFMAQRQAEQDAFVEKLISQMPYPGVHPGLDSRASLLTVTPKAPSSVLPSPKHLASSDLSSPIPSASRFRSEHMLVSEDFATEAAFRMKQFEHEEEDSMPVHRTHSVRHSRKKSSISEEDDKLHSVREFEGRTSALEGLVISMKSSKRLHLWCSQLPCGKRCLKSIISCMDWLCSLEEPEREGCCNYILESSLFCSICTLTILANVAVILYTANYTIEQGNFQVPAVITGLDIAFCVVYFVESALKLIVHRAYFFWNEESAWNIFDLLLVMLAIYDQVVYFFWQAEDITGYNANMNFMRSLRIVKVSRILRLVRVIRIFRDLRCMLFSILWSFSSLFWCLVLIFFVILVFSLLLVQLVTEYIVQPDIDPVMRGEFKNYFGSVETTMATLYMATTGGVDWRVPYEILAASGELSCAAFLAYVAFFEFAVFNVLTGVFVDHAMKVSAADRELALAEQKKKERTEAERLRDTCRLIDADGDGKISWPEFHAFLHYENGYRNMASLGLDIFDSKKFFKNLMVMTNQREIEITQFVSGCMRMKGGATGIDLHSVNSDLDSLHRRQSELQGLLTTAVRLLQDKSIRRRSKLSSNSQADLNFSSETSDSPTRRDTYSVAPEGSPVEAYALRPVRAGALLRSVSGLSQSSHPTGISILALQEEPERSTKLSM
ncbi:unnamed protein product [Durusdinium trenchii]|uniref:EF-hand domain-containing protein n=1 Tax=Durusdinium trenchii TaxID=1381693 RepID=A0ABP0PCF9_9DINO